MVNKERKPFKRIHFFSGFATTADDWNAAEAYHNKKRKLHNYLLHTPGIIPGFLDGLRVEATADGRHVSVGSGCAIDAQGRELLLPITTTVEIKLKESKSARKIYVVLRYQEAKKDFPNPVNQNYDESYKFIEEYPVVEFLATEPETKVGTEDGVEIARIDLGGSGTLTNADIDTSYVKVTGPRLDMRSGCFTLLRDATSKVRTGKIGPVLIEKVALNAPKSVYFVNAFPEEGPGPVSWQIASTNDGNEVSYYLNLNIEGETSTVSYQVYRLTSDL